MSLVMITHLLGRCGHDVNITIAITMVTQISSLQQLYNRNKLSHKESLSVYLQGLGQCQLDQLVYKSHLTHFFVD